MALPTQTAISDEIFHEPDLLRAAAGRRSRQLGDMFEQWILRGCDWYWDKEIAYIEKTPEPMRPIKVYGDRRKGQFIAIYTKQAQPDFKGTLCDCPDYPKSHHACLTLNCPEKLVILNERGGQIKV